MSFLIYVNDLPSCVNYADITLYEDDNALCYSDKDASIILDTINHDLANINTWLEMNRLTLSAKKPKFMMIGSIQKMKSLESVTVTIGNTDLQPSNIFKYLGVSINCQLTWDDHVYRISSSILKKLSLFRRIKAYLPIHARKLFYFSYIMPQFDYCDIVWGDRGNSILMKSLQVLQNKIAKEILDRPNYSSTTDALTYHGNHLSLEENFTDVFLCINV